MIDRTFVGARPAPYTVAVERDRLLRFAEVVGITGSVYTDLAAAHAAGYPDLPVPPALLAGLERQEPGDFLAEMGVRLTEVRHIEQGFVHHRTVHAGDLLTFAPVITDIYSRRHSELEFIVRDTTVTRGPAETVAELHQVIAVQYPQAPEAGDG